MRDRILGLVEKADLVIGSAAEVVDRAELTAFAATVRNTRSRLSSPDDVLIAALVGGTGSGKSSLFNALSGAELAEVGGVRPTTGRPLVAVPEGRAAALAPFFDELGIEDREVAPVPSWLCLIDMPDTDSVELDHRLRTESLLARLDVLIWVVDPEKYRDAALHTRYIEPLAAYAGQFLFVLNQADRLAAPDRGLVAADFLDALERDGIPDPVVIVAAADPPAGPPQGGSDLMTALESLAERGSGVYEKLAIDLSRAAADLLARIGPTIGAHERLEALASDLTRIALEAGAEPAVSHGGEVLEGMADEVGGPVSAKLREFSARLPTVVQEALDAAGEPPKHRRVLWREQDAEIQDRRTEATEAFVRDVLVEPAQSLFAARAESQAALVDLSLDAASVLAAKPK